MKAIREKGHKVIEMWVVQKIILRIILKNLALWVLQKWNYQIYNIDSSFHTFMYQCINTAFKWNSIEVLIHCTTVYTWRQNFWIKKKMERAQYFANKWRHYFKIWLRKYNILGLNQYIVRFIYNLFLSS